ncbi:MAG: hypothetical protein ACXW4Q_00785 [Anaerolineales bacterium]
MKSTSSQRDREIIELLESLKSLEAQYPPELLAARRAAFLGHIQIAQRGMVAVQESKTTQDHEIIKNLERLKSLESEYPSELLAARRAAFIDQISQRSVVAVQEAKAAQDHEIIKNLESLKSLEPEYPSELLPARRAAFIAQVVQRGEEVLAVQDKKVINLLESLKSAKVEYPPKLLAARRSAFIRQIVGWGGLSLLETLRSAIRSKLPYIPKLSLAPMMQVMRTSLVIAGIIMAAFVGSLMGNRNLFNPTPTENEIARPLPVSATSTQGLVMTICEPGYLPPLCLAEGSDNKENLTFQGNGVARAAVAKDNLPGLNGIHHAAHLNDGLYGNGASWISNSAYSWIKIDLGKLTNINTVTFGRDRLGNYNDRDPGQFTIAVALSDNIYSDGNSSKDSIEYTLVYDSERAGFDGSVSAAETVQAYFGSVTARFVKITFTNPGTAIDEVEVFLVQPSVIVADGPVERTKDKPARATSTNIPTDTPQPTDLPTNTPRPTSTPTDVPTDTPWPTRTPTDIPTDTPEPTNTPQPTEAPTDIPSETPLPPTEPPTLLPMDTPTLEATP